MYSFFIIFSVVLPICGTQRDDCHQHATCTDTGPNEYKCKCNEGYTGDGKTCDGTSVLSTLFRSFLHSLLK